MHTCKEMIGSNMCLQSRLFVQNDWLDILRKPGQRAWISCSTDGKKTAYGEVSSSASVEHKHELNVSDGFEASVVEKNVLKLKNMESDTTSYFYSPIKTFSNLHKKAVRSLNISPGGSIGVSCSEDETLCIWQTDDGSIRRLLEGHISDVTHCRFFPSGVVVLSGGIDMRLKIWSVEDGTCPVTLIGHKGAITDSAILDRGRNIISCSRDGTAKLWDCGTAACLTELTTNGNKPSVINACALATHEWSSTNNVQDRTDREVDTTGKLLVLAKDDGIVEGIDIRSRDRVFQCDYQDAINTCCFVNDHRLVAGQQSGDLVCLDIRNTSRPEQILRYGKAVVHCVQPYFRNTLLVGRGDGSCSCIRLNDDNASTKELIGPNLDAVYGISFANNFIYTACRDGYVRKYCLETT